MNRNLVDVKIIAEVNDVELDCGHVCICGGFTARVLLL